MIFDFKCPSGHINEKNVSSDIRNMPCPTCGADAVRIISGTSVKLPGWDPGYPGAYDKWARDHEKAAAKKHKG